MAEDAHVIRGINWRETFPFTNIFRSFRIAIQPSKLILGLLALLFLCVGGWFMDEIWPAQSSAVPGSPAVQLEAASPLDIGNLNAARLTSESPNEVELYAQMMGASSTKGFDEIRKARREEIEKDYQALLLKNDWYQDATHTSAPVVSGTNAADVAKNYASSGKKLGDIKDHILEQRKFRIKVAGDQRAAAEEAAKKQTDSAAKEKGLKDAKDAYDQTNAAAYAEADALWKRAVAIEGDGIFRQFFTYEISQVNEVVAGVSHNDWLGGIHDSAVVPAVMRFLAVGPLWLINVHLLYAIIFGVFFLIVWSVFGGAICRIAAVHVARDEKLSLRQALKFSLGKLLSFIFAPIIPLVIVIVVGIVVAIGGLIGNIPVVGPWVISILFFLALGAGFVMTLVLLGTIGGFNLMYPTVAVEGSDSFDAISRSFSYVYARPWRMLWYTIVAIVYGAITFMFVKLFVSLMLMLTHYFVSKGMYVTADSGLMPQWDALWPVPSLGQRTYHLNYLSLSGTETFAAVILSFWVYLVIAMIGAYAISFYFSSNTVIYYLMRREVDATELDDVYLEQTEEEFETAGAASTSQTTTGAPSTGEAVKPAENPAGGSAT